ncbi:GNAT family N-acetyltransferase [Algicola sagamiensis]|uniref:GNAT family N-acetyltransferase n=1 Tax=Algicola sagamiensis TaxID=163869 RepID=UPI000374D10E|nr:GNAT family protein [Algicola sagamiensis]
MSECLKTNRLVCLDWATQQQFSPQDEQLLQCIIETVTEQACQHLPGNWQPVNTKEEAVHWLKEREADGRLLFVIHQALQEPIGFVLLFEEFIKDKQHVNLGYLLSERFQGQGFGTELLNGFVEWRSRISEPQVIHAGVSVDNPGSIHLLEKAGFERVSVQDSVLSYVLSI